MSVIELPICLIERQQARGTRDKNNFEVISVIR